MPYRAHMMPVPWLPDGRLASMIVRPGLYQRRYLAGHISPTLLRDLNEYARHISHSSLLTLQPERVGDPCEWDGWYERVPGSFMPLTTCNLKFKRGRAGGRDCFIVHVRADMMSEALCRELNEITIPETSGALRYTHNLPAENLRNI